MKRRWAGFASTTVALSAVLLTSACASIINGSHQTVKVRSKPEGARIFVDEKEVGLTPTKIELRRKERHVMRLELEGYEPYEVKFNQRASGLVFVNLLFGGLIGFGIDAATGGLYKLEPGEVDTELAVAGEKMSTGAEGTPPAADSRDAADTTIMVILVEKPDPSWEKIGRLTPITN